MITEIFKYTSYGERKLGYIDTTGQILSSVGHRHAAIGRVDGNRIYRLTTHDEQELGYCDDLGTIHSHGLFEGGELGWVDQDGVVVRAGLIFGEEEVGRVEGPHTHAAAAALLLLFLPAEAEEEKRDHANR